MADCKVLYIHPSNELYGSDRSLLRLVNFLDNSRYEAHVIVPNDLPYEGLLTSELQKAQVSFQEINLGVLRRRYRTLMGMLLFAYRTFISSLQIALYCRKHKIDIIHSNSTAIFSGGLAARLAGIPHICHVREIITQPAWLNKVITANLSLFTDLVITVSRPARESLLLAWPSLASKTLIIHNGIDPQPFLTVTASDSEKLRQTWGLTHESIVVGTVGRFSAWKGQELLVEATTELLKSYPCVHLILVGGTVPGEDWRKERLKELILESGVQNQIQIEDFRHDIPAVLAAFDIFVLPSIRPDPFPGVVLEAMFAGKPVIATAHGGAIEQVEDGNTGILVSPTDPTSMTKALSKLISQPKLRQEMGEAGQQRAWRHFTVDSHVRKIDEIYQNMVEQS